MYQSSSADPMVVAEQYQRDVEAILARRYDNGGDYWASSDGRIGAGSPFSTLQCVLMLSDLGMESSEPVIKEASKIVLDYWREDGRFHLAPKSPHL